MFCDFEFHVSYLTSILFKFTRLGPVYAFLSVIFDILIIRFVTFDYHQFCVELDLFLNYLAVVHLSIISLNKQARSVLQLRRLCMYCIFCIADFRDLIINCLRTKCLFLVVIGRVFRTRCTSIVLY